MPKMTEILDPIHPGEILLEEFLKPMKISREQLSRDIDVPKSRISEICNGLRVITADTALRLSAYFGNSAEFWMNLQTAHDLRLARQTLGPKIEGRIRQKS